MLFYTSKDSKGEIKATYGGHSAFTHFERKEDWESVYDCLKDRCLNDLWNSEYRLTEESVLHILLHEFTHKQIFSKSESGKLLVGMRYILFQQHRAIFFGSYCGTHRNIANYYRMRAIYIIETLPYQEALAQEIQSEQFRSGKSLKTAFENIINNHNIGTIEHTEERIIDKWDALGLTPETQQRQLYKTAGDLLHANSFAVIASHWNQNGELAYWPILDNRPAERPHEPYQPVTMFEKALQCAITAFRYAVLYKSRKRTFEWYWIGQRAQIEILEEQYYIGFNKYMEKFVVPASIFIMNLVGMSDSLRSTVAEITEDSLNPEMDIKRFMNRWQSMFRRCWRDRSFRGYFQFFTNYGN